MNFLKCVGFNVNRHRLITSNQSLNVVLRKSVHSSQQHVLYSNAAPIQSPEISIPDLPQPLDPNLFLNALNEPTFASLELNSYWPSGWYQSFVEILHVSCDLPWWGVILTSTLLIRSFIFPLIIKQRQVLVETTKHMPKMNELQEKLTQARLASNNVEFIRLSMELRRIISENNVNPLSSLKYQCIQMPVILSVYTGLYGMVNVPVPSLKTGGLFWFQDLTVADPYYVLPFICASTIFAVTRINRETMVAANQFVKFGMTALPVIIFLFIMNQPSAIAWYWSVNNSISLFQSQLFLIPAVKQYLNIPDLVITSPPTSSNKGFRENAKEYMNNMRFISELESRERIDARAIEKSVAKGRVTTYAANPKQKMAR